MTTVLPTHLYTQAFIDGRFVDAADGTVHPSIAPATGQVITQVAACDAADVDRAVKAARRAFESGSWRDAPLDERKTVLLRFADLIEAHAAEIALLDSVDAGKTITDCTDADLPDVVQCVRWYAEAIDKVFGKVTPESAGSLGLVVRQPIGVVGIVLPWNFPAAMLAWKMAPALAAGNSLVVKPAELSPLSALRFAALADEAGIPAGVFNVVPGLGETAGEALGRHPDVDIVTFTGSTEVGRLFLQYSAESNLKQIVLECGGKSPQIVTSDPGADLAEIAEDLAAAAFTNAGQNCTAGSRVLVHASIAEELTDRLVAAAQSWAARDPLDPEARMGPLIEPAARERTLSYVEGAVAAGARIRCGGTPVLEETGGYFVAPTVIDEVTESMAIAREEVFGPVVSVLRFGSLDEALRIANDTTYGLAATVWARDINVAIKLARGVNAGTVAVNGYSEGDVTTPFGGHRQSGFGGRDNGLEAFDQYTELKTIWITLR